MFWFCYIIDSYHEPEVNFSTARVKLKEETPDKMHLLEVLYKHFEMKYDHIVYKMKIMLTASITCLLSQVI